MIIYCTSVTRSFKNIVTYAKLLVLEKGSGMSKLVIPDPHLNPQEQLSFAEDVMKDNQSGGYVVVASTYELPILRIMRRIREEQLDCFQFLVHYISKQNHSINKPIHILRTTSEGEFLDPWPEGFFEERMPELF